MHLFLFRKKVINAVMSKTDWFTNYFIFNFVEFII